jgi:hypothetical protein
LIFSPHRREQKNFCRLMIFFLHAPLPITMLANAKGEGEGTQRHVNKLLTAWAVGWGMLIVQIFQAQVTFFSRSHSSQAWS